MRIPRPRTDKEVRRRIDKIRAWSAGRKLRSPLDPGIAPLVAGLIRWRVGTRWSCEGHLAQELPVICFDKRYIDRVLYLASEWAEQKGARFEWAATQLVMRTHGGRGRKEGWAFPFFHLRPLRPIGRTKPLTLRNAKKDALAFGRYLLQRKPKNYG